MSKSKQLLTVTTFLLLLLSFVGSVSAMETGAHTTTRQTTMFDAPNGNMINMLAPNSDVTVTQYNPDFSWASIVASVGEGWVEASALTSATNNDDDCVIPPSGPWPPCATGGDAGGDDDCVIPPSGPWPPCATGGDDDGGDDGDCVIPPSGPWPPCATGGGDDAGGGNGDAGDAGDAGGDEDCVIPPSGPWPPCATGGDADTPPPPADDPPPPPAEAPSFPESPVRPFDADEFRMFLGLFRDSLRSFQDDLVNGNTIPCSSYIGWLTLWVIDSPAYTDVPDHWYPLYFEWRVMLDEIVSLTGEIRAFCSGTIPGETEIDVTEVFIWLLIAYPRSEEMVVEANATPN